MGKYYSDWYERNRERLLPIRKKYNKCYSARPEVIKKAKIKNAMPEKKEYRKEYKKTKSGKLSNKKYSSKPEVILRRKELRIINRYGITQEDYNNLYKNQEGRCAICNNYFEKLDIDHCHRTNKVRGLLCGACNRALGLMKDNVEFLNKAIKYLLK